MIGERVEMTMKNLKVCILLMVLLCVLSGCAHGRSADTQAEEKWDKIPMVMVDGALYYDTGEESSAAEDDHAADGKITSTVDGSETPTDNDQSNFGEGFAYRHTGDDTVEILMNGKWIVFEQREGTGSQVRFGDKWVDKAALSEETLEWLSWYNSLPELEQLAVSAIPEDLLEASGIASGEDVVATIE